MTVIPTTLDFTNKDRASIELRIQRLVRSVHPRWTSTTVANFANAWRSYQQQGHLSKSVRGSVTGGIILTLVASAFLFDLDWGMIWPLFLIIGGLSALMGGWFVYLGLAARLS